MEAEIDPGAAASTELTPIRNSFMRSSAETLGTKAREVKRQFNAMFPLGTHDDSENYERKDLFCPGCFFGSGLIAAIRLLRSAGHESD